MQRGRIVVMEGDMSFLDMMETSPRRLLEELTLAEVMYAADEEKGIRPLPRQAFEKQCLVLTSAMPLPGAYVCRLKTGRLEQRGAEGGGTATHATRAKRLCMRRATEVETNREGEPAQESSENGGKRARWVLCWEDVEESTPEEEEEDAIEEVGEGDFVAVNIIPLSQEPRRSGAASNQGAPSIALPSSDAAPPPSSDAASPHLHTSGRLRSLSAQSHTPGTTFLNKTCVVFLAREKVRCPC